VHLLGVSAGKATRSMQFLHDGAAAHFALQFQEHFTATYEDRWNERGGSMAWPPRSLDFTPMDSFLWVHFKALFYKSPVNSEDSLISRIVKGTATTR